MVEDLVADDAGHLEALLAGDRVDDHVAMDADEVLRVQDAIFILRSGEVVSWFLESLSLSNRAHNGAISRQWADPGMGGAR